MARPPVDIIPNLQVLSTKLEGYPYIIRQLPAARIWLRPSSIEFTLSLDRKRKSSALIGPGYDLNLP
jgi:hypothetical protein